VLINRLTKFDKNVNVLFGRSWRVHNSKFLPKGGFAQGQDRPQFCLNSNLEDLWVLPDYIGKGVGKTLFKHAIQQAKLSGAERLELDADPNAAPFYTRMGCQVVGESISEWGRAIPHMTYNLHS
jgi:GNAT superfamily N-acetyltransferase